MRRGLLAAGIAMAVVGVAAFMLAYEKPESIAVLCYLVAMLTAGLINDIGPFNLGEWKNGFFLPSPGGYVAAAIVDWIILFFVVRVLIPRRSSVPATDRR